MQEKNERRKGWYPVFFLVAGLVGLSLILGVTVSYGQAQGGVIDLNTASQKDLESLKGVGPATAKKIIAGRPYKSAEDLKKAGISEKTIESMKPYVKAGAGPAPAKPAPVAKPAAPAGKMVKEAPARAAPVKETPVKPAAAPAKLAPGQKVNINTATKEQLEALSGIGPVKAQAVIDGRPYKKTEDIMKVKGIKGATYEKIKDMISVN